MFLVCCKNDFLNFLKRSVLQSFPPKTQGFACKSGLSLSFGAFACGYLKITACLVRDSHSFKKALSVF
ncbi:hypothetical protein HPY207_07175 [Helicobacter pylori]|nr:hypothetical protein HPY207_07175 [Helicobacter pylori]